MENVDVVEPVGDLLVDTPVCSDFCGAVFKSGGLMMEKVCMR